MAKSKGADAYAAKMDRKATAEDHKFFALRESGYKGWIDENNNPADCPSCGKSTCTASLTERCNG